jgi:2-polyprenyl-3-methyl-5-hydroxy-6-metoxy-1,4-benzoquinol methylase
MPDDQLANAVNYFSSNAELFGSFYDTAPEFIERLEVWKRLLDQYCRPGERTLDVGCGTGVFTFYAATKCAEVVGIDAAAGMLEIAERRRNELKLSNVSFVQAVLPDFDHGSLQPFDLLISSSVVEYVPDLDATLLLFHQLLKPRSKLIVSMPNSWSMSRVHQRLKRALTGEDANMPFVRHFSSPAMLSQNLARFGFQLRERHYYSNQTRLSRLGRSLRLPSHLTADLFVIVMERETAA